MTEDQFNSICAALPATTHVVQWRGSHVWKVGGKVFAFGRWDDCGAGITFKVSQMGYEILKEQPGLRPAPYLASRGMTWLQRFGATGWNDQELVDHIRHAHAIVAQGLPRKRQAELGVLPADVAAPTNISLDDSTPSL